MWDASRQDRRVVKTGARAQALRQLLVRLGFGEPLTTAVPGPRLHDLPPERVEQITDLYRALGGRNASPQLRPGGWDVALPGGVMIELDEELHFNRYRWITLQAEWAAELPWRDDYSRFTVDYEPECLAAAQWGKRWTNPSCESLFGVGDPPGTFATGGAPRWKQRALYDAMKDAAALSVYEMRVVRLATVDVVGGVRLGTALAGGATVDLNALSQLLAQRSC